MDLSNIAMTTDRATLARYAAEVSDAAEWVTDATNRLESAIADYADRVFTDEAAAEAARAGLYHLRRHLTTAEKQLDRLTAAYPSSSPASPQPPRSFGGYANAETQSVIRCIDSDARAVEIARAIVATAWANAADAVAADRAAIVAPRQDAADDLRDWLEEEENPLADSASLFTDLLTHALERVDWRDVADHYAPDPLPSLDPIEDEGPEESEEEAADACPHQWVMIRPMIAGPDGWAKRCKLCDAYIDISAEARAAADAELIDRIGLSMDDLKAHIAAEAAEEEAQEPPAVEPPSAVDAAWIDHNEARNAYHDLPHNTPPSTRRYAHERMESSLEQARRAEERERRRR